MNDIIENNGSLKDLLQNALYTEAFSGNCKPYKAWLNEWKKKYPKKEQELDLVKALAASFFLWKGIDGDREKFMESLKSCGQKDQCLDVLKNGMRGILKGHEKFGSKNKTKEKEMEACGSKIGLLWAKAASDVWQDPPNTARFLLMCAFDQAVPDEKNSRCGFLRKDKNQEGGGASFLNWGVWEDTKFYTVEHVAPWKKTSGWDEKIYISTPEGTEHRANTLGNFLFLPHSCNSSASNRSWEDKKEIYGKCAYDQCTSEQHRVLCRSVLQVEHWDADLVRKRSQNMAQMIWETLSPWLDE